MRQFTKRLFEMKNIIIVFLCMLFSCTATDKKTSELEVEDSNTESQNYIDSSNYYRYYYDSDTLKGTIATGHLHSAEIVPTLLEEIRNAGFDSYSNYIIYKLSPTQNILLTAYNDNPQFGFIYIDNFEAFPKKSHRKRKSIFSEYDSCEYQEVYRTPQGNLVRDNIKKLPPNIHLLQSDLYWYQFSDTASDNKNLVKKATALEIFRKDVRAILRKISKKNGA